MTDSPPISLVCFDLASIVVDGSVVERAFAEAIATQGIVAGTQDYARVARPMTMDPERCVATALRAFDRGAAVTIPGALNFALAQGPRFAPRALTRRTIGTVFGQRP